VAHQSLQISIGPFTSDFVSKLLPTVVASLLSLHYLYPNESERVAAFLIRIARPVIMCFCAELSPNAEIVTHLYNCNKALYRLDNPNMKISAPPAFLELARRFPGQKYLGRVPARLQHPDNPPRLAHEVEIFRILGSVSHVTQSAAAASQVTAPFFDRMNLRGINFSALSIVLRAAVQFAAKAADQLLNNSVGNHVHIDEKWLHEAEPDERDNEHAYDEESLEWCAETLKR
jgi:hypothetical protein